MENHFKLSDADFKKQFENCELSPADFSHQAHLRLAWINIETYGIEKAAEEMQKQLINFVTFLGATDKYNKTVTLSAMKVVHHFRMKSKSDNFRDFIEEFPRLDHNFKELLASHYSFDIINSAQAKIDYLEPDLLAFD